MTVPAHDRRQNRKRKTVSQTCRELGISETTFARWREQALAGMEVVLAEYSDF